MKIRLGYVSIAKTLELTCSKTITYTNFKKDNNFNKIDEIIVENLNNLEKIIDYNIKNNIHFYRLTSKLIPLATKSDVVFDYILKYQKQYQKIGEKINNSKMRVDVHPDQFCVLNSTKKEVLTNTFQILEYHYKILEALNIKNKIIILHIGSNVFGKENSIKRFINNFYKLPHYIQNCIAVENDDKIFNIVDCLNLCQKLNIPFVLDYHHHLCNNDGIRIDNYLKDIFNTWHSIPKIHFSSPKNQTKKEIRSHHDYINVEDFIKFLDKIKYLDIDLDIMLEAKAKDEALFKLVRLLKYYDYKFIDETTLLL